MRRVFLELRRTQAPRRINSRVGTDMAEPPPANFTSASQPSNLLSRCQFFLQATSNGRLSAPCHSNSLGGTVNEQLQSELQRLSGSQAELRKMKGQLSTRYSFYLNSQYFPVDELVFSCRKRR